MARTIKVDYLARVEGEGALTIRFRGDKPESVSLRIFEPPRFFEGFLRGRSQLEAPDITARICGICPVAYQMSACHAIEDALGMTLPEELRRLRRLLYCGEWVESHVLHMFLLHLPDFLGYQDAVGLAKDHGELVRRGLRLKQAGNRLMSRLGGREIHPINVKIGGFYKAPSRAQLGDLLEELCWARDAMDDTLDVFAKLSYPEFERDYEFVALRAERPEYPFCEGRIVSSKGLDIAVGDYEDHFVEEQVEHSTALHSRIVGRGSYVCGPLARLNLNFDRLGRRAAAAAGRIGFSVPCNNPYKGLLARGIETLQVLDEAVDIIENYTAPSAPSLEVSARAGTGHGCTEAPRGILFHRYGLNEQGIITDCKIVPPTSQNQRSIEEDLFELAFELARMPHADATWRAEQAVRNYDPCISCSTHFLKLDIQKNPP